MPIRILPEEVASQIAAGEVVERPASVVKELLENSLDAGASQISIKIERAGSRLIEVGDNGSGIPIDEVKLAVARHATSKLRSAQDLQHVTTLGFRGEALASIASVSHMTLSTCVAGSELGSKLSIDAGHIQDVERISAPVGTLVRVQNLFHNVPARKKFLKADITERRKIDELVSRYALAYPQVRFILHQDGKPVLQTSGNDDRREVLAALYGIEIARQMLELHLDEPEIRLEGFTSPISLTRSNRREVTFFVNGRWIQDVSLSTALIKGYHTLLMVGRYPLAVVFLHITPEKVDVNVHPTKAEVRFQDPGKIFSVVQRAVRRTLLVDSPVPAMLAPRWQTSFTQPRMVDPGWEMLAVDRLTAQDVPGAVDQPDQAVLSEERIPLLRLVGQVGKTYLVAEGPDGLYLIDQHAAHERVLYERFLNQRPEKIPSQRLLEGVTFQLPPGKAALLEQQLTLLQELGFDVELFGPGAFRVRAIPAFLSGADPIASIQVLVEEFEEDETPLKNEIDKRAIARICKRAAVKGGQTLSADEQVKLLRDLEGCQSPRTCPHGRPTMIHLSVDLLERQFGRRGSR
jgi:DNA mismatch repair protein MutL